MQSERNCILKYFNTKILLFEERKKRAPRKHLILAEKGERGRGREEYRQGSQQRW
jgi:hypothetical protein